MNRISASFSAFSAASAVAASLLLAACAPDSLTSSDSSRVQSLADSAARDSLAGRGPRDASRGAAVTAGTDVVADAAIPGAVEDTTSGEATDATSGTLEDTTSGDVAVATSGAAEDTSATGTVKDTADVVASIPADSDAKPGAVADVSVGDAAASAAGKALEGAWKRSGHLIEPGITLDGVLVTDLLMQDAIESRDNLTRFQAGGVWTEDEGPMKSAPASVQSEDGAWTLNAAGDVLSLRPAGAAQGGDHFDFKVLELSASTLKVATVSGDYADGRSHTETITFTRQ